jgi:diguanylate cyclase (GGDEF)-like protein
LPDHPQETPRLSPQGSFETWKEIVKATSLPWQILEMEAAKELRTTLMLAALEFSQAALLKANHQLSLLASLDGLTGIANRRRFDECIMTEWQRAIREQHPLSLILIDVDYFKNYNDTYGHLLGDDCLKKIAEILQKMSQRATDLAARYGGEEFVLVLPNTSQYGAQKVAQRIKAAIAHQTIHHKSSSVSKYITLSMGIMTIIPNTMMEMADFIRRTDQALFKAKSEGRDRIVSMNYLEFV